MNIVKELKYILDNTAMPLYAELELKAIIFQLENEHVVEVNKLVLSRQLQTFPVRTGWLQGHNDKIDKLISAFELMAVELSEGITDEPAMPEMQKSKAGKKRKKK